MVADPIFPDPICSKKPKTPFKSNASPFQLFTGFYEFFAAPPPTGHIQNLGLEENTGGAEYFY